METGTQVQGFSFRFLILMSVLQGHRARMHFTNTLVTFYTSVIDETFIFSSVSSIMHAN